MIRAIILAAGKSQRMGANVDKAFLTLGNKPVAVWSLLEFERCPAIDKIVLVVRKDQKQAAAMLARTYGLSKVEKIVIGGNRRQDSVANALEFCASDPETKIVVIHDAARPLIKAELIEELVKAASRSVAVTVGHRVTDTIKRVERGIQVSETEDRNKLWAVQTPQAFQFAVLRKAYAALDPKIEVTDDCQVMEKAGEKVKILENLRPNIKITTVEDLQIAGALLR